MITAVSTPAPHLNRTLNDFQYEDKKWFVA